MAMAKHRLTEQGSVDQSVDLGRLFIACRNRDMHDNCSLSAQVKVSKCVYETEEGEDGRRLSFGDHHTQSTSSYAWHTRPWQYRWRSSKCGAQGEEASQWSSNHPIKEQARSEQLNSNAPSPDLLQRVSLQQSKCTLVLDDLISASCTQPSRWVTDFDLHVAQFCFPSHPQPGGYIAVHGLEATKHLNGFQGVLGCFSEKLQRWKAVLAGGTSVNVRSDNFTVLSRGDCSAYGDSPSSAPFVCADAEGANIWPWSLSSNSEESMQGQQERLTHRSY